MMENTGVSLADIAAVTDKTSSFGDGSFSWIWIILIFAVFMNGGFFGANNQQYATAADVQRSTDNVETNARFNALFDNQSRNAMDNMSLIDRNAMDNSNLINDVKYANLQNTNALQNTISQGFCGLDKSIMQSSYATTQALNDGFAGVQQGMCNISHQISDGVCAIKTQLLQDKYDSLLNDYNLSTMANSNAVQTQNILSAIGSWYAKPPYAPYYGYGTTVS